MVGFHHHKREKERDGCSIHFIRFPCFIYTFVETNCTRLWIVSFNIFVSFPMHCILFFIREQTCFERFLIYVLLESNWTNLFFRIGIHHMERLFLFFFFFFFFLVKIKESYGRFLLFSSLNTLLRGILKS